MYEYNENSSRISENTRTKLQLSVKGFLGLYFLISVALLVYFAVLLDIKYFAAIHIYNYEGIILATVVQCIAIVTCLVGYVAIRKDQKASTALLLMLLVALLLAHVISAAVITYQYATNLADTLDWLWDSLENWQRDDIQEYFRCCGFSFVNDRMFPSGICSPRMTSQMNFHRPCYNSMRQYVHTPTIIFLLGYYASALLVFMMSLSTVGMLFSPNQIQKQRRQRYESENLGDIDNMTT